jgi:hypothetical protein
MLSSTPRTRHRKPDRSLTGREDLYAILDAGMICHLGVVVDDCPMVVPTVYGRIGDTLYLHGSTAAKSLRGDGTVCVTVTHVDGIVLARSVFNHSMNYRCAMIYGEPRLVTDPRERLEALRIITEQVVPGRWEAARQPTAKELAATRVLALSLEEASVKVRSGPPGDEPEDYALPIWAGVLPVRQVIGSPDADPRLDPALRPPDHVMRCVSPPES